MSTSIAALEAVKELIYDNICLKIKLCLAKGVEPVYEKIITGDLTKEYNIEQFNEVIENVKAFEDIKLVE